MRRVRLVGRFIARGEHCKSVVVSHVLVVHIDLKAGHNGHPVEVRFYDCVRVIGSLDFATGFIFGGFAD